MSKFYFMEADNYKKVAELGTTLFVNFDFIRRATETGTLHSLTPEREYYLEDENDPDSQIYYDIYQYYFIDNELASLLADWSDEILFYDEETDLYIWGVTHFGTPWEGVPFHWFEEKQTDYYHPWDVA